jgi:hypothetical protein
MFPENFPLHSGTELGEMESSKVSNVFCADFYQSKKTR